MDLQESEVGRAESEGECRPLGYVALVGQEMSIGGELGIDTDMMSIRSQV